MTARSYPLEEFLKHLREGHKFSGPLPKRVEDYPAWADQYLRRFIKNPQERAYKAQRYAIIHAYLNQNLHKFQTGDLAVTGMENALTSGHLMAAVHSFFNVNPLPTQVDDREVLKRAEDFRQRWAEDGSYKERPQWEPETASYPYPWEQFMTHFLSIGKRGEMSRSKVLLFFREAIPDRQERDYKARRCLALMDFLRANTPQLIRLGCAAKLEGESRSYSRPLLAALHSKFMTGKTLPKPGEIKLEEIALLTRQFAEGRLSPTPVRGLRGRIHRWLWSLLDRWASKAR